MIKQVATITALVVGFLVVLLLGGRLIRYFGIAAEGRLDVGLLFSIIGFNLPYFLELLLPLSFFIGLMLVFGRLYVDNEMAVINGSGLSRGYLGRLLMPLIVFLFILEASLSLYGKPWGVRQSDTVWQQQALSSAFDLIRTQRFISSDDYHLYVGSMSEDRRELQNVILIQTGSESQSASPIPTNTATVDPATLDPSITSELTSTSPTASTTESEQTTQNTPDNTLPLTLQQATANNLGDSSSSSSSSDNISNASDPAGSFLANSAPPQSLPSYNIDTLNQQAVSNDTIILAKRAIQVDSVEGSPTTQLDLYQGRRYEVGAGNLVYNQVSFERYRISIDKPPEDVVTDNDISTQTLPVLWQIARRQPLSADMGVSSDNNNNSDLFSQTSNENDDQTISQTSDQISSQIPSQTQVLSAQAELGYRFALPWLMILAPMLAIPLAQVRPRQGRWLRLLPAILIFVSVVLVISSVKNSVAKGNVNVWINAVLIVVFMLLALYLNWASRIHHRVRFRMGKISPPSPDIGGNV